MAQSTVLPPSRWRGLGTWNLYFLGKFALIWFGLLNFQVLPNLLFAAALLLPLPRGGLILRAALALPVGVALLYHDSWLPPFETVLERREALLDFSSAYLLELAGRLVDWQGLGKAALVLLLYLLLAPWLRLTTVSVAGLLWLGLQALPVPHSPASGVPVSAMPQAAGNAVAPATVSSPPDNATLDRYLTDFYRREAERQVRFDASRSGPAFDLLFLNVCSLAWDDLREVGLDRHPLLQRLDIRLDNFNSATAYSGPGALRLQRANCGQASHAALYEPAPEHCHLFDELSRLGYQVELALNHNGRFDNYLQALRQNSHLPPPLFPAESLPRMLVGFDGSPINRDLDQLSAWWKQRQADSAERVSLLYQTITLHDGNRTILPDGGTRSAGYAERAQHMLDDLEAFIEQLERRGRPTVVVLIPEHGASLHGDRLQIAGMREIPSPSITHIPVGIKFIGLPVDDSAGPQRIAAPTSYLALAELLTRLYAGPAPGRTRFDLASLARDLPQTAKVSENAGSVVLEYAGRPYVRLQEHGPWLPYPQSQP